MKFNIRTEVCMRTADPQVTMQWIKEVQIAKSIDELVPSRPDFEMLDAMIASALRKLINTHIHFRKRVSVEEQRAQNSDRFLLGRPIAYMIYEHFRATGVFEAAQGLADLVSVILRNDAVQDFDVLWGHALSAVSEMPSPAIVERLYKSKLHNSAQLQTVMALHDHEVAWNDGTPDYQQLKTAAKLHIDHMMRNRNFRARNDVVERGSVTRSQKWEKKPRKRKWASVFSGRHKDNVPKETLAVSVMTNKPLGTVAEAKVRDEKRRSSSPAPHPKAKQTDGENGDKEENSHKRSQFLYRYKKSNNPFVSSGILPCVWTTSLKKVLFMATHAVSDKLRQKESQTRNRRKVVQRISCHRITRSKCVEEEKYPRQR